MLPQQLSRKPKESTTRPAPTHTGLPPGLRADLLDPTNWQDSLDTFARATNLAVTLVGVGGSPVGPCLNPRPTWRLLHSTRTGADGPCPFSLASPGPCTCVADALAEGTVVVAHDPTGLVHFAVPLRLGEEPLGALVAGQVFDHYPEQLALEQVAKRFGLPPQEVWHQARLENPVKQSTLRVYGELLSNLSRAFLQTRYHALTEAGRLDEMTRLRDGLGTELAGMQLLQETSTRLIQEGDASALYDQILDAAIAIVRSDMASMQVLDAGRDALRLLTWRGFGPAFGQTFEFVHPDTKTSCGVAWRTGQRVVVPDVEACDFLAGTAALEDHRKTGIRAAQSTPLLSRDGRLLGMLSTHWRQPHQPSERELRLLDVLARQAADLMERVRAEQSVKEADRRKTEFLAMLAHELRNPLAPIRNAVRVLRLTGSSGEAAHAATEMMERQVGQMVLLVDDLLDVSRISRGKIELRRGRVELASVIHHAVEAARPAIERANHNLTVTLPQEPMYLDADPTRLAQVVGNLLNNACKFTDRGGRLWLTVEREGGQAVIRVRDSGIGIAADQLPQIFDLFVQLDTSLERSVSGLGIGLALVKSLVEMHGGTVAVHSAGVGQGSEFVVWLPVLVESERPAPAAPTISTVTPVSARRILVVDDNRDSAGSLAMLLTLTGNETHIANDGQEAVEAAAAFQPDVVLLDIGLPKMNGYEAARRIREQQQNRGVILVALTGWGQEEDRRLSQDAGFNAHLVKPVDLDALSNLLVEFELAHRPTAEGSRGERSTRERSPKCEAGRPGG